MATETRLEIVFKNGDAIVCGGKYLFLDTATNKWVKARSVQPGQELREGPGLKSKTVDAIAVPGFTTRNSNFKGIEGRLEAIRQDYQEGNIRTAAAKGADLADQVLGVDE